MLRTSTSAVGITAPVGSRTNPEIVAVPDDACPNTAGLVTNIKNKAKLRLVETVSSLKKPGLTGSDCVMFDYLRTCWHVPYGLSCRGCKRSLGDLGTAPPADPIDRPPLFQIIRYQTSHPHAPVGVRALPSWHTEACNQLFQACRNASPTSASASSALPNRRAAIPVKSSCWQ